MSKLKDFYVNQIGHDYNMIKNSNWYLAELTLNGAIEIDKYLIDKPEGFEHVKEFLDIFEDGNLINNDHFFINSSFEYIPFWDAVKKDSDKNIRQSSELALEMKLFLADLKDVPNNFKRLENIRDTFVDFSREFSSYDSRLNRRSYLVA